MPHYWTGVHPWLYAVADTLHAAWLRQRFVATCLQGPGAVFQHMFSSFKPTLIGWRSGCISEVTEQVLAREVPLRSYFNLDQMKHRHVAEGGEGPGQPAAGEPNRGPNLQVAARAISSAYFWGWLRMFATITSIVSHIQN